METIAEIRESLKSMEFWDDAPKFRRWFAFLITELEKSKELNNKGVYITLIMQEQINKLQDERDKAIEVIKEAFAELGQGESFEAYKTLKELGVKNEP